jgi:serine/threonine-protein kinase
VTEESRNSEATSSERGNELIGQVLAGRYRVERLLGSGGMGSVYRAEHIHMRKAVAVKVLHREMTAVPEVVARFEREAVAAGRIEHPNVVQASDFGRLDDGAFYLVLEYVEGQSLAKLIERGTVAPERALHITRQVADALAAAHAQNIIHRDLKPDNVMLVDRENYPDFVKVLDFGIAKVRMQDNTGKTQQLTQLGTVFGTPEYMSPEQARGNPVDGRSDLYTLGVMLYEMLTGTTPFKSDDLIVVLTRTITEAPAPLPNTIPEPIRTLTMRLLRKLPEERVAHAVELIGQIDAIIGPSQPPPPMSLAYSRPSHVLSSASETGPVSSATAVSVSAATSAATLDDVPILSAPAAPESAPRERKLEIPAWLLRPIAVGRRLVPAWSLVAAALGLVVIGATGTCAVAGGARGQAGLAAPSASTHAPVSDEDAEQQKLRELAEQGDQTALAQLEAKSKNERSAEEWRAIGHGYCQIGQLAACITKYRDGVTRRPALAKDPIVLADVRKAAQVPDAHRDALELAALHLWAPGVDIVYDVWASTKGDKSSEDVNKRARDFVEDGTIRAKASPELKVALELQRAIKKQDCATVKKSVKAAVDSGDVRSVPFLEQLRNTRGCGLLGLGDCWSCLRGAVNVSDAIEAAKKRPAPTYGTEN